MRGARREFRHKGIAVRGRLNDHLVDDVGDPPTVPAAEHEGVPGALRGDEDVEAGAGDGVLAELQRANGDGGHGGRHGDGLAGHREADGEPVEVQRFDRAGNDGAARRDDRDRFDRPRHVGAGEEERHRGALGSREGVRLLAVHEQMVGGV